MGRRSYEETFYNSTQLFGEGIFQLGDSCRNIFTQLDKLMGGEGGADGGLNHRLVQGGEKSRDHLF